MLLTAVAAYAVTGELWLRHGAELGAVALMAYHVVRRPDARLGWAGLLLANVVWVAGDLLAPRYSWLYLVSYGFAHLGYVLLVGAQARRRWRSWIALDGVLAGLAAAAILTSFVSVAFVGRGVAVPATMLGGDAVIVTTMVLAFAVHAWRPGRALYVLAASEAILVATDLAVVGATEPTRAALVGWSVALLGLCWAAAHPLTPAPRMGAGWIAAGTPIAGGAVSLVVLMHAALTHGDPLPICLAGAALAVGLVRATLLLAANQQLLRRTRVQAVTDKLTGLPNRRALTADLDHAFATRRPHTLAFFDLDGFKEYNDAFGHAAGDALLRRLAPKLGGYRLGGDEFCVLLPGALDEEAPEIRRAVAALSERGNGFTITASFGLVVLPREVDDAAEALQLADERMYARKRRRRAGQARDLLMQVLAERGENADGVAERAAGVGRLLGLGNEDIDVLIRAAELRDIGMLAIPDGTAEDEPLFRQHPVVAERILAVAESMRPVARIVRSAREHFDGTGYPDALRGERIPLGARIIAACVADEQGTLADDGRFDPLVLMALSDASASSAANGPARSSDAPSASARRSSPDS